MSGLTLQDKLKHLPSVTEVDKFLKDRGLPSGKPVRPQVLRVLEQHREAMLAGEDTNGADANSGANANHSAGANKAAILDEIATAVNRPPPNQLCRVINATGVVVHTNLGRAVLPASLTKKAEALNHAYLNLEFDLETGKRGGRGGRVPELLATLSGAEAALTVNNNAAAVLLMLTALAAGQEVIVSRGELVEIGGAFRVPDIMRQSGVTLVEVGTTNRTRLSDYADAITENTAAVLKVHRSNFAITGFTEETTIPEMAELAQAHHKQTGRHLGVWHDLGSGAFYRFQQPALRNIPTVTQEIKAGADIVTLSGDKLLGSVQAGIVVGANEPVGKMRKHPLYRSLRMDRVRSALLEQSLLAYLDMDTLLENNTVIDLLERTPKDMIPLAKKLEDELESFAGGAVSWERIQDYSLAGGGAVPEARIETLCLAFTPKGTLAKGSKSGKDSASSKNEESPEKAAQNLADQLRQNDPPIIARLSEGRLLIDLRTIFPQDIAELAQALKGLCRSTFVGGTPTPPF